MKYTVRLSINLSVAAPSLETAMQQVDNAIDFSLLKKHNITVVDYGSAFTSPLNYELAGQNSTSAASER